MAKTKTPKEDPKTEVKAEAKETPKKETKKAAKFDPKKVSQSAKKVNFTWSSGKKSGETESMSENLAEIMEGKKLGKKEK